MVAEEGGGSAMLFCLLVDSRALQMFAVVA